MTVAFTAVARPNEGGILLIEVPAAAIKKLGERKRVPVNVTLNGVRYRSTIAVYGDRYYVPARREIREAAGLVAGRPAKVSLSVDLAPRTVTVPPDLARALAKAGLTAAFGRLSFTNKKEYADAVSSAKRPETRAARIPRLMAQLRAKESARKIE